MQRTNSLVVYTTAALGVAAAAALIAAYAVFEALRPKMVHFEPLTSAEEGLVNYVGIGLILALVFCLLAVFQIVRYSTRLQRLSPFHLLALAGGVLTALFIFADIALLGDIGKQYESGLAQPEWTILYLVIGFQVVAIAGLVYAILFTLSNGGQAGAVLRDSSVFLLAQAVGVICGAVGLALTVLNLFFPRPLWMVEAQIVPTLIVILVPYALIVAFWVAVKWREGDEWFDEKQRQDVGISSFLALVVSAAGMGLFYFLSLGQLQGMVSVLWFPFFAFLVLLVFSAANFSRGCDALR